MKLQRAAGWIAFAALVAGCGAGVGSDEDALQREWQTEEALYTSSSLWNPPPGSNVTRLRLCWVTAGWSPEKAWVQDAVANSWQAVSWVAFDWLPACDGTENVRVRIEDTINAPHANGLGRAANELVFNFTFNNWGQVCASAAERRGCIETIAVHEMGHVLGLSHEQNRADFELCGSGNKAEPQGPNGDLPMFAADPDSIMSYCPEGQWGGGGLSPGDVAQIQRLYGGWAAPVISGEHFALRLQSRGYARMSSSVLHPLAVRARTASAVIQEQDGTRNLVSVRRQAGPGQLRYGDRVSLQDSRTGLYYCWLDFGSYGAGVAGGGECFWELVRPSVENGNEIYVNDPVIIRWPAPIDGEWKYFARADARFLGSFPRTP